MPGVPLDADNLVWRRPPACGKRSGDPDDRATSRHASTSRSRCRPGLGGGSADAAAALLALARSGVARRHAAAGSRRPPSAPTSPSFFRAARRLASGSARRSIRSSICRRTGSSSSGRRSAFRPPRPTAWYDDDRAAGVKETRELQMLPVPWPTRAAQMINDLEPPVLRRHPEITALKSALREAGAVASAMSGSGSAVFGLFRSRAAAARCVKPLVERRQSGAPDAHHLTRAEYERRARPVAKKR